MNGISNTDMVNLAAAGESIQCASCGTMNKYGNKFCIKCGSGLIYGAPEADKSSASASVPFAEAVSETNSSTAQEGEVFAKAVSDTKEAFKSASGGGTDDTAKDKKSDGLPFAKVAKHAAEPEEVSVFAQGLPEWNIEPPQVMVRRKKAK